MIRRYEETDLAGVLEVWERSSAVAHPFLTPEFMTTEKANVKDVYLPNAQTWVWADAQGIKGFLSLQGREVGALFVDPGHHGRGIGRALMDQAFALNDYLELDVFEANPLGRRFYDRYGFTVFDRYTHLETGEQMLRLKRRNPDPARG